jgi:seryl-tRNA(Sec) selenium transferase
VLVALEQSGVSSSLLEERLRGNDIPIITRTERDRVILDLRTVAVEEEATILDAIVALSQSARETTAAAEVSAQTHTV